MGWRRIAATQGDACSACRILELANNPYRTAAILAFECQVTFVEIGRRSRFGGRLLREACKDGPDQPL